MSSKHAFYFDSASANFFHLRPMLGLWAGLLALLHGSVTLSTHGLWIDPLQKCGMAWEGQRTNVMIIYDHLYNIIYDNLIVMLMTCVADLPPLGIISFRQTWQGGLDQSLDKSDGCRYRADFP